MLVALGVIMVFSASYYNAGLAGDSLSEFKSQLLWAVVGLIAMIITSKIDYKFFRKLAIPSLIVGIILLVLVLLVGAKINDARRWFILGPFSFQPAELVKLCVVLFMARSIELHKGSIAKFRQIPIYILVAGVIGALLYFQPNLSMALIITILIFVMLFLAGMPYIWIIIMGGFGLGGIGSMIFVKQNYWMDRIKSFQDIFADPLGKGYQVIQSLYALGAGGLFGMGLGQSRQKYKYLPYSESDFIFAIIGEELGFIGACFVIILFGILVWRLLVTGAKAPDIFGAMVACGMGSLIAIQAIINIAVVTHTIPATGVPLPFISAGGSSLAVIMSGIGIVLNISKQTAVNA